MEPVEVTPPPIGRSTLAPKTSSGTRARTPMCHRRPSRISDRRVPGRYGPPPRAKYLRAGIHAQWRATNVSLWRILLKNSVNDQMTKVFCVLSAVAYRGDDGGASYTRNLAQTALRGVKVASDCAATYRKNPKGISTALHIRVFQQNSPIADSAWRTHLLPPEN